MGSHHLGGTGWDSGHNQMRTSPQYDLHITYEKLQIKESQTMSQDM